MPSFVKTCRNGWPSWFDGLPDAVALGLEAEAHGGQAVRVGACVTKTARRPDGHRLVGPCAAGGGVESTMT